MPAIAITTTAALKLNINLLPSLAQSRLNLVGFFLTDSHAFLASDFHTFVADAPA